MAPGASALIRRREETRGGRDRKVPPEWRRWIVKETERGDRKGGTNRWRGKEKEEKKKQGMAQRVEKLHRRCGLVGCCEPPPAAPLVAASN